MSVRNDCFNGFNTTNGGNGAYSAHSVNSSSSGISGNSGNSGGATGTANSSGTPIGADSVDNGVWQSEGRFTPQFIRSPPSSTKSLSASTYFNEPSRLSYSDSVASSSRVHRIQRGVTPPSPIPSPPSISPQLSSGPLSQSLMMNPLKLGSPKGTNTLTGVNNHNSLNASINAHNHITNNTNKTNNTLNTPHTLNTTNNTLNASKRTFGTPSSSSDSVLDRLRYLEGSVPLQNERNSIIEGKIFDLGRNIDVTAASIAPGLMDLSERFERELAAMRREHESR